MRRLEVFGQAVEAVAVMDDLVEELRSASASREFEPALGRPRPQDRRLRDARKTFKGLTDALLAWQTEELLAREVRRVEHVVHVGPELVVEIAFNEVQSSSRYPGGVALRFARVKGYRPDKGPDQAETIDAVRAIHAGTAVRSGRQPASSG